MTLSYEHLDDHQLLEKLLGIYDQRIIAEHLNELAPSSDWSRESINRMRNKRSMAKFSFKEFEHLHNLLPEKPLHQPEKFRFIDLFAGIGGIRKGFESVGGKCVFTSEWDKYAIKTYKANHYSDDNHVFNEDIRDVTLSNEEVSEDKAYAHIDTVIPDHEVLLAGFPCQPFSIAGVSKKNSLGRLHGFECNTQGTLFFDVARILAAKKPPYFLLENVKNLKSHDSGKTFATIMETLDDLGYYVVDEDFSNKTRDPKVIDAQLFLPQHRERIVLVGVRKDLGEPAMSLSQIKDLTPKRKPSLGDILEPEDLVDKKYILTPKLWLYLYNYAKAHKAKGNGFGFGLVGPNDVARTLSARYYKDGSEILIDRGIDLKGDIEGAKNIENRPRRLTPRECARLMGFDEPQGNSFKLKQVSDTQAYKQFGNSVAVPVFSAVAELVADEMLKNGASKVA